MLKIISSLALFCLTLSPQLHAQDDLTFHPSAWTWNANITGTISNVSFKNWTAGNEDYSYVAGMKIRIDPTWSSNHWSFVGSWDGRFSTFGGNSLPPHKTEDRLELNLKIGRQFWYGSTLGSSFHIVVFADLRTQFLPDYDLTGDPDATHYISNFMAPGWVTDGIGLDYRSDTLNLSIVITPIASKETLVLDHGVDPTYYGLNPGQKIKSVPGAYAHLTFEKEIIARTKLSLKSIFFKDYEERSRVDVSFLGEIDYSFTSFFKLYASLQLINDDDIKVNLYEDLDGDGDSDDFVGVGNKLQLYGQLGFGLSVSF